MASKKSGVVLGLLAAASLAVGCGPKPTPVSCTAVPLWAGVRQAAARQSSSAVKRVMYYLPSRVLDLLDVVSLGVGIPSIPYFFPASAHVNVHATRAFQVGAGGTHGLFIGWGYGRDLAWTFSHQELSIGPLTVCDLKYTADSPLEVSRVGMLLPTDPPFEEGRMDYWAIGAHVGALVTAVDVDVHLVEIADALLGFLFIDLSADDLGVPRDLHEPKASLPPVPNLPPAPAPAPR
jgi:hypothetical protein